MTTRRPLLGIILSLVVLSSLLAFIQLEKDNFTNFSSNSHFKASIWSPESKFLLTMPTFSEQLSFRSNSQNSSVMANSTRTEMLSFIVANPGIQFRGICAGLGVAIGTAEFHLGVLIKAGLVSFVRDGKYKRFFAAKKFSAREMKIISLLRHETTRLILKRIVDEKSISHCELASELSITSQGLTWQMNRLKEEGVVRGTNNGSKVIYFLNEIEVQALPVFFEMTEERIN